MSFSFYHHSKSNQRGLVIILSLFVLPTYRQNKSGASKFSIISSLRSWCIVDQFINKVAYHSSVILGCKLHVTKSALGTRVHVMFFFYKSWPKCYHICSALLTELDCLPKWPREVPDPPKQILLVSYTLLRELSDLFIFLM